MQYLKNFHWPVLNSSEIILCAIVALLAVITLLALLILIQQVRKIRFDRIAHEEQITLLSMIAHAGGSPGVKASIRQGGPKDRKSLTALLDREAPDHTAYRQG